MLFTYKIKTKEGRIQKGEIKASSKQAALDLLEKYHFYTISLKQAKAGGIFSKNLSIGRAVSKKDLVMFTRQVATMLSSAITPIDALRSQISQTDNAIFRAKILEIVEAIETGKPMSYAFSLHKKIFDDFYISMLKSGEASGKIAETLNYLADHLERSYNFNQKIKGAMFYPVFVVFVFLAAMIVVVLFIVPKLTVILQSFDSKKLPILTKILMKFGAFVTKGGWVVIIGLIVVFIVGIIFSLRSKKFKVFYDEYSLKIPFVGNFFKKVQINRFAENLSVLITSGLPIIKALNITKDIINNSAYKKIIDETEQSVKKGEKISDVLKKYPGKFPSFAVQMVSTGESTGKLGKALNDLVDFYRGEIERSTEKLTTMLEPILILTLGIGIAFLAFAVFVPLFNIGMSGA